MKDAQINIRISTIEKNKFDKKAAELGMDLSTFILTAAREKVLKQDLTPEVTDTSIDISAILKRLDQLEKLLTNRTTEIQKSIVNVSEEYRSDLLMNAATNQIYYMLQQEEFQLEDKEEIKNKLIIRDPKLAEFLENKLFSALDLALEKLEEDKFLYLSNKGIKWLHK